MGMGYEVAPGTLVSTAHDVRDLVDSREEGEDVRCL